MDEVISSGVENGHDRPSETQSGLPEDLPVPAADSHSSPDAVSRLVLEFERRYEWVKSAKTGLEKKALYALAGSLNLDDLGFEQALQDLNHAVRLAGQALAKCQENLSEQQLELDLANQLADRVKQGDFNVGSRIVDEALHCNEPSGASLSHAASRVALLELGLDIDLARHDPRAAVQRIEAIVTLSGDQRGSHTPWSPTYWQRLHQFLMEGQDEEICLPLEVGVEMARRMVETGSNADERGAALLLLGQTLGLLGAREKRPARLEEAVVAYREALKENHRERVPLQWAANQMHLGVALKSLADRESGCERLIEAVGAYCEALKEWTTTRVPRDWALTQMHLGAALATLGEREGGTGHLVEAANAYGEVLEKTGRTRFPLQWAATKVNLGNVLMLLGERQGGTGKLKEAIAAYRDALLEVTRERQPQEWAAIKVFLGSALYRQGER
ncbi:MAG: hypothetical protein FWC84_05515, partial [Alphaproteobacteria bacterium]|nr:hypothetical protein [Alphaproteobacteria bacterium]